MEWINSPPVEKVTDEEFARLAREFIKDHEKNWMLKKAKSPEGEKWNQLVEAAINEADVYRSPGEKFVYKLDGKAAALMRTSVQANSIKVEDLSAHKGSEGGGAIMIEYAVNLSQDRGKNGVLTLFAAGDEKLQGYYKKRFGFQSNPNGDSQKMKLDPRVGKGRECWDNLDGKWHLKYPKDPEGFEPKFLAGIEGQ